MLTFNVYNASWVILQHNGFLPTAIQDPPTMATLDDFTVDEKKSILQLRERIENQESFKCELLKDDLILYKFLKGCNFRINDAEKMIKKHIKWRKIYQVDRIIQDYKPVEVLESYVSQSFMGFDKEGCPIRYSATGNMDIEGIFKSATLQDFLKCVVHLIETDIEKTKMQSKEMKKTISQFIYIYNLENLTITKALNTKYLNSFMLGASIFQDNYPERLKNVFIINAPVYFSITFAILKSVLSIGLLPKIKVFRHNFKDALLEVIDENVLPAFLGGKRTDPDGDPLCKTIINHGYPVPEKYYLFNSRNDFRNNENVKQLTIRNQTTEEVEIFVEEDGSFIEWEFQVQSKDIGFGLSFENNVDDKSKRTELIPVHRIETPFFPENGMYYCENSGKYIIIFDNSYSLWTSKEVFFKTFVNCKK